MFLLRWRAGRLWFLSRKTALDYTDQLKDPQFRGSVLYRGFLGLGRLRALTYQPWNQVTDVPVDMLRKEQGK